MQWSSVYYSNSAFQKEQERFADSFAKTASTIMRSANSLPSDREMTHRELLLRQQMIERAKMKDVEAFKQAAASDNQASSHSEHEGEASWGCRTQDDG